MDSKQSHMEAIFRQLSEQNQDVMILLAKSMAVAQAACMKEAGQKLEQAERGGERHGQRQNHRNLPAHWSDYYWCAGWLGDWADRACHVGDDAM